MRLQRSRVPAVVRVVLQERRAAWGELNRQRIPHDEREDLVQETLLRMVRRILRGGPFLVHEDEEEQRKKVRNYLRRIAQRLAYRWHLRATLARVAAEIATATRPTFTDPTVGFEARSELRALDIPEDMVPLLVAVGELGSVSAVALALGMRAATVYTRLRNLRRDLRAAGWRRKGRRGRR